MNAQALIGFEARDAGDGAVVPPLTVLGVGTPSAVSFLAMAGAPMSSRTYMRKMWRMGVSVSHERT